MRIFLQILQNNYELPNKNMTQKDAQKKTQEEQMLYIPEEKL